MTSMGFGIFWAVVPFLGWSGYAFEGAMITCSVEWNKRTPSVISYNIFMFIFVYMTPLIFIIYTNFKMYFNFKSHLN